MKWAPSANQLAYISGEGRFFVENKKLTIADMVTAKQQKEYTPIGYVDLDLEWLSPNKVVVARAKENKVWKEGPVPTLFTTLYMINIKQKNSDKSHSQNRMNVMKTLKLLDLILLGFAREQMYIKAMSG